MPSMASVWPITPPANREKCDQLVPNWNSIGMPVTTPNHKIDAKNLCPKTCRLVVHGIVAPQADSFKHDDQQSEAHGELRKKIMKSCGKGKVKTVNKKRVSISKSRF